MKSKNNLKVYIITFLNDLPIDKQIEARNIIEAVIEFKKWFEFEYIKLHQEEFEGNVEDIITKIEFYREIF